MKRALALCALSLALPPDSAGAQGFLLSPPSIGEAMDRIERLERSRPRRGHEQTFILPERPGQNQVAWYGFDWHHYDVPSPSGGQGGIRLYFYRRERAVAERALPVIRNAYLRLVDQFHYTPTKQIPYILYGSQREFQTTNLFQVSESVLGVTSPKDLKMTLPYFGDHEKFREVSTHEMVHQFTIQKLLDIAGAEEMGSLVEALPLWFIEGIAEYYSKGGLDSETDGYLRDLVWNPDPERRYQILPFAEDRYRGYLPTYKLGQARVAFVADVYGKEKIQGFIENAYVMGAAVGSGGSEKSFAALTRRVLGEGPEQVDARWRAWLKRRYYPEYMSISQDLPSIRDVPDLPAEVEAYVSSADGSTIFARGIDREVGRARLYLFDTRNPRRAVEVVSDDQPGYESLHPLEQNILALSDHAIAFAAQNGPSDSLYYQTYKKVGGGSGRSVSIQLGKRHKLAIAHPTGLNFIEVSDPTFSADSSHIAFVGLTELGQRDIYVVPATGGTARQVTDDPYNERDLAWGLDGIYCSSDATDHGVYNLFRVDPGTGERARLTTAPANDRFPRPQADGSVLYSSDADGKPDLYILRDRQVQRVTDFATGLSNPAAAPAARGIWAQTFFRGRFRLVEVPKVAWLDGPLSPVPAPAGPPLAFPTERFPEEETPRYNAYSLGNWRPEAGIVYGGGAANAVAGRAAILFSDMLRDNLLYLDLAVYGSFAYTQGLVLFENRSSRTVWALGAYHYVQQQLDRLEPSLSYLQRDFGAVGVLRFPLDRFRRIEAELQLGGVERYCLTDSGGVAPSLSLVCGGITGSYPSYPGSPQAATRDWNARNGNVAPIASPTLRYGYDTVRYDAAEGPVDGTALLLEVGGGFLPTRSAVTGFARIDAQRYWRIIGRSKFFLRFAGGTSFAPNDASRTWARSWWLTSADNLRGFYPLDLDRLVGQNYYVANGELHIPLDALVRFLFFDYIAGVAAVDYGGVFNHWDTRVTNGFVEPGAWESRTLTGVLGFNVLFGPLLLRVHFGHPFDIGGQPTPAQVTHTTWVTNITLRYFFF